MGKCKIILEQSMLATVSDKRIMHNKKYLQIAKASSITHTLFQNIRKKKWKMEIKKNQTKLNITVLLLSYSLCIVHRYYFRLEWKISLVVFFIKRSKLNSEQCTEEVMMTLQEVSLLWYQMTTKSAVTRNLASVYT